MSTGGKSAAFQMRFALPAAIAATTVNIVRAGPDELAVIYFDPQTKASTEALVDIVVLSVGLVPSSDNQPMARMLDVTLDESGFMPSHNSDRHPAPQGIFTAGAATGPMSIAESVSSAQKSVYDVVRYLTAS